MENREVVDNFIDISEILPGKLYLGSADGARTPNRLRECGITYTFNVCSPGAAWKDYIEYGAELECNINPLPTMWFPLIDGEGNKQEDFNEAMDNLNTLMKTNEVVFVHCRVGISRSTTFVATWYSKKFNVSLKEAIEFVKSKRHFVNPKGPLLEMANNYLNQRA